MRHLTITSVGRSLHLADGLLQVREKGNVVAEYPLNRLRSVQVAGRGVSLSSNLLADLAARGIPLFIIDYRGRPIVHISGTHQHAVAELRRRQIHFLETTKVISVANAIVRGKIKNQRAVLLYFAKGMRQEGAQAAVLLTNAASELAELVQNLRRKKSEEITLEEIESARAECMGYEGRAAAIYWRALREARLLPRDFTGRAGRGATDIGNQCLNLGYVILMSHVWHAVTLAGLEPYLGVYHAQRPGKPSLVLDLMEEYRPWVVDRNVIKLRHQLNAAGKINAEIRKAAVSYTHLR
ncbi:MAG: CRISPR-associated endonuclease Cas1, partial [Turneriella sp.]|nr:CRISPR-associated endonuclease Cas1 [Turneriella sp.]